VDCLDRQQMRKSSTYVMLDGNVSMMELIFKQ